MTPNPQQCLGGGWRACLASIAALLLGCSDTPSEPALPFQISFTTSVGDKGWSVQHGGHQCQFTITATASGGRKNGVGKWRPGEVQVRFSNASTTLDLTLGDMLDYWGGSKIAAGANVTAALSALAPASFDLTYKFRYLDPDGRVKSAAVFVDCSAPPPSTH